jgi:hypothetical protein
MNDPATAWAETTGDLRAYGDATRLLRARLLGASVTPRAGLAIWPAEGSESRRNRPAATRRGGSYGESRLRIPDERICGVTLKQLAQRGISYDRRGTASFVAQGRPRLASPPISTVF